jgi:protein arginine N-methyltransferase 5
LAWASHLSLPAVILPTPSFNATNYAHCINSALQNLMYMQMWTRIPLKSQTQILEDDDETEKQPELSVSKRPVSDPWQWWNNIRSLCEHHPSLGVALEVTEDLPDPEVIAKWLGEPVKALIIPTKIFMTNKQGYPSLSKQHQTFIGSFFKVK